jgi:hypothetical protein
MPIGAVTIYKRITTLLQEESKQRMLKRIGIRFRVNKITFPFDKETFGFEHNVPDTECLQETNEFYAICLN